MNPLLVDAIEGCLRLRNRLRGVGRHPEPLRHFGDGGVEEAEALCARANRDLLAFVRPPSRLDARNLERGLAPHRLLGSVETLRFDSPMPSGSPENDRVQVRLYRPPRDAENGRLLVFHHPFYQFRWAPWEWFLADLMRRMPVAMMAGPYHFDRLPAGDHPGERACNPNPWRLFEAFRQWSWDQRAALDVLRERCGLEPAAVAGFSVGAFQTLLSAAAGALELPIVSIASTNRYAYGVIHGRLGGGVFEGMRRVGIDEDRLWRMTESIQLERHVRGLRGAPVLYVVGAHDRVDPPPSLQRLEDALRPTRAVRLPAGHSTVMMFRRRIVGEIVRFLEDLGVIDSAGAAAG